MLGLLSAIMLVFIAPFLAARLQYFGPRSKRLHVNVKSHTKLGSLLVGAGRFGTAR